MFSSLKFSGLKARMETSKAGTVPRIDPTVTKAPAKVSNHPFATGLARTNPPPPPRFSFSSSTPPFARPQPATPLIRALPTVKEDEPLSDSPPALEAGPVTALQSPTSDGDDDDNSGTPVSADPPQPVCGSGTHESDSLPDESGCTPGGRTDEDAAATDAVHAQECRDAVPGAEEAAGEGQSCASDAETVLPEVHGEHKEGETLESAQTADDPEETATTAEAEAGTTEFDMDVDAASASVDTHTITTDDAADSAEPVQLGDSSAVTTSIASSSSSSSSDTASSDEALDHEEQQHSPPHSPPPPPSTEQTEQTEEEPQSADSSDTNETVDQNTDKTKKKQQQKKAATKKKMRSGPVKAVYRKVVTDATSSQKVARRHTKRKKVRSLFSIVTHAALERLKLRAGIPRLEQFARFHAQCMYETQLKLILKPALLFLENRKRKILEPGDVSAACKYLNIPMYA